MKTTQFAALAARHDKGLAAYGTFTNHTDARLVADRLGATDEQVFATLPIALHSPDSAPLSTTKTSSTDEVFTLPDAITSLAETQDTESTINDSGAVVALAVLRKPQHPTLLVGPFDCQAEARNWHERAGGDHVAKCYLLPLRSNDLDIDGPPKATNFPQAPTAVLLDIEDGSVVYGLFDNATQATLFYRDLTNVIELTNVRQAHICELISPTDNTAPPSNNGRDPADHRVRGWVVRLTTIGEEKPRLIGPFDDEHSARTWRTEPDSTNSIRTVLPIYTP